MPVHSLFSPSGPRTDRVPLDLPCTVHINGHDVQARVIDISLGGLGLSLAFDDLVEFRQGIEGVVSIDSIGRFEIECRWVKGNRIGAQFRDDAGAAKTVQAYFDANGLVAE